MNITQRPYINQGYRAEQESNEQTQDALSQDSRDKQQNENGGQNNRNPEPRTIAKGRAPLTAHGNRKPFPGKPVAPRQPQQPVRRTPQQARPPINQTAPSIAPRMPVQQPIQQPIRPQINNYQPGIQQPAPQYQPIQNPAPQVDPKAQEQINNMAKNNRVNIAQVIKDFRGTYAAIGTPQCLVDEVEDYLKEVIEHTKGEAPSINFVQTNLQNAAIIIDKYISETLDKDSKVVQNWLDALFLQRINYKYNDGEINEDFLVKFPEGGNAPQQPDNVEERASINSIQQNNYEEIKEEPSNYGPIPDYQPVQEPVNQTVPIQNVPIKPQTQSQPAEKKTTDIPERVIKKAPKIVKKEFISTPQIQKRPPQITIIPEDTELRSLFVQAKKYEYSNNPAKAMNIFQKALLRAESINDTDTQSKICFEIGKIYDDNNYLSQALNSYNRSLQNATDTTIKTKAHYSMAKIYDDVNQVNSAINHYITSVSYAGKEDNLSSQSQSLTNIANIYTDKYNSDAFVFYDEANILIDQTDDYDMRGYVSSNTAGALNKFNKPDKALKYYANAVKNYTEAKSDNSIAENYLAAGELMYDLKNPAKAKVLLNKALSHTNQYIDKELINKINDLLEEIG